MLGKVDRVTCGNIVQQAQLVIGQPWGKLLGNVFKKVDPLSVCSGVKKYQYNRL